jgi:hypothetical protein
MKIGAKCIYEGRTWIFIASQQQYATKDRPPPPTQASLGSPSLLLADRRQQLEAVYLEAYLPSGETTTDTAFTNSVVATWIPTICYLASKDRIARLAFDSCILMALGQMQGNLDFTHHGMAMYCQALTKTNRALQHTATAQTDATLATCEILAMCEKYRPHTKSDVSTQASDFQRHVQGTAKLLELRGSHRHVDEHGFTLFVHARSIIAHSGITQRRRAYLGSSQWFEVPWSMQDRQRTLRDKLVDAMLMVGASLEQLDQWCHEMRSRSGCQPSNEASKACISACVTSVQLLQSWEIETLRASAQDRLEDVCADRGLGIFHLIMSYWAVFLLLSARCWPVLNCISEPAPALGALAALLRNPRTCALNIATYAHRYFPPTTGLVGPQYATFPLGVALNFITVSNEQEMIDGTRSTDGRGKDEITTAMNRIQDLFRTDKRAKSTAEFLGSMAPDPAPQNLEGNTKGAEGHGRVVM